MSVILMNIVAYLAILALLGFIAAVFLIVQNALSIVKTGKGAIRLIDPAKDSVMGTINAIKGFALLYKERGIAMGKYGKTAAQSVGVVKDEIADAIKSMDFENVTRGARKAVDGVKQSAKATSILQQVIETYIMASAANTAKK